MTETQELLQTTVLSEYRKQAGEDRLRTWLEGWLLVVLGLTAL